MDSNSISQTLFPLLDYGSRLTPVALAVNIGIVTGRTVMTTYVRQVTLCLENRKYTSNAKFYISFNLKEENCPAYVGGFGYGGWDCAR